MYRLLFLAWVIFAASTSACEFRDVQFKTDFSNARLNDCVQKSENSYVLTIRPENHPINNSPWYAFKVQSRNKQKIRISIRYEQGKQRYLPKVSRDGNNWMRIPYKIQNEQLVFELNTDENILWVAGQEIITNQHYVNWLEQIEKQSKNRLSIAGYSSEKRPIYQLESFSGSNEWLVILGRMHPPEVTGALALFPFVQELLFNQAIGKKFRDRFNILIIPNVNPDGVENGHWRHNSQGVDLNRDWKKLKQQETQSIHKKLQGIVQNGGKIVFAIDFHSTRKNVFYTMPDDYGVYPPQLVNEWLIALERAMPDFEVINKPGNNPNNGVFKQYIADNYKVHAITYEMADTANRKVISQVAKKSSQLLMEKLLATPSEKFLLRE